MPTNGEVAKRMRRILKMAPNDPNAEPNDDIRRVWAMGGRHGRSDKEMREAERIANMDYCEYCGRDID